MVSAHAHVADHFNRLPPKSLARLYYLQIMEPAHVQTQLRDPLEQLVKDSITHKCHQASHASSYNGNLCRLGQCYAQTLLNLSHRAYSLLLLL